jgi:DNA-binding NtrC family response regulator
MTKNDVMEVENLILNSRVGDYIEKESEVFEMKSLSAIEKHYIKRVLDEVKWNKLEASRILEITRPTLNAKIEKYFIQP